VTALTLHRIDPPAECGAEFGVGPYMIGTGTRTRYSNMRAKVKSEPGPPMTLGNAAAAGVRLIVWCKDCRHQIEPDPAEMAQRYGAETTMPPDWRQLFRSA
jgi:hypothetical protein